MEGPVRPAYTEPGYRDAPGRDAVVLSSVALFGIVSVAVAVAALPWGWVVPGVVVVVLAVSRSYRRPLTALSLIILGHVVLLERTEGITIPEILFGVYLFGFIGWWFFDRVFLRRERVCVHPADWLLMAFLVYAFLSVVPAIAAGSDLFLWLREYLTVATLFLYFPLRSEMKIDRGRKVILGLLAVMVCGIAVNNILSYGVSVLAANYFWELLGARKAANAHFFFPALVVIGSYAVHQYRPGHRWGLLLPWLVVCVALLFTFARGFWIGGAVGLFAVFVASPSVVRKRILGYGALLLAGGLILSLVTAGEFTGRVFESLLARFTSSGTSLADISLRARFVESQAVFGPIMSSPLIGNGFGAEFSFYNILTGSTLTTVYTHNGYLFLLFKVGVVGTLLLVSFCLAVLIVAWRERSGGGGRVGDAALLSGSLGVFAGLLLITVTSNVFIEKESLLVISVLGAGVISSVVDRQSTARGISR